MKRKREWFVVLLALTVVVLASVVVTLVATQPAVQNGVERTVLQRLFDVTPEAAEKPAEIPFQVAFENCRRRIAQDVGDDLQNIAYDNRSSRYQSDEGIYQVFVNVYFRSGSDSVYSRCNVSSADGEILEYRLRADQGFLFSF